MTWTSRRPAVARSPLGLIALVLALATAPGASAEPVTHTFSGTVSYVTDGTAGTFEDRTFTLVFFDSAQSLYGAVQGVLDGVTTPALATSWGRVKGMYRGQ